MATNGGFPDSLLAHLGWPEADHLRLVPTAAASVTRLAAAFESEFSKPLYLSDAYRTFASQVSLKITKGVFAATPGTSVHGLGLAIDAASRINVDGSAEHRWMEANAGAFGWVNPAWAQDYNSNNGQHEPWHWEYHPALDTKGKTPAPAEEDDMPQTLMVAWKADGRQYVGDGITRRWLPSQQARDDLYGKCKETGILWREFPNVAELAWLGVDVSAGATVDTAALAAAVVKALPAVSGGLTPAQVAAITAAVKAGLTTLTLHATA